MSAATGTDPVTVPILTGTGTVFTAGADLREAAAPGDAQSLATELAAVVSAIEDLRCPVVAAVNGAAAGGGLEVALACDLRIASADAVFVAAGVNVGLIASFWRLPRVIGLGPAKQMLLTGRPCDAETALRWGLVGEVHPPRDLLSRSLTVAEQIAGLPPLSVEATKACTHEVLGDDRPAADRLAGEVITRLFATADHGEAVRAFLERRPGRFTGR
jgi:enoyl-CoA hydratase